MTATLATVDKITKEVYQGKITNQLQEEAIGYKRIEGTSEGVTNEVGGKYVTFPIRIKRNAGIGYRNELETLQDPGRQGYESVRVPLRYGYGRVLLSGQVIKLAQKNFQAFASAMEEEMSGLKSDIQKDTNRIFYGDGLGTLATLSATSTGTTLTCATGNATKFMEVGQVVDVVSPSGTVRTAKLTVTSVTATTVVVDSAVAAATSGDLIVRNGNYGREPQGLSSIVAASGTLYNVDPTVVSQWKATVDSNGGTNRALSEGLMIKNTDVVRTQGGKTSLILYGLGVRRSYFNLLSQQRRYTNTTEFAGGLKGLAFNNGREIPCVDDVDVPNNTMFGLDESSFKVYREEPWNWMDRDGGIWKWVNNKDAYEAVLHQYWELGTKKRNANFRISDITES